jgi:hypothetical protein
MAGPPRSPQRRVTDHWHPEYWTESDHFRFEDRVSKEIHALREEVKVLGSRLALGMGGLAVIVFVVNLAVALGLIK